MHGSANVPLRRRFTSANLKLVGMGGTLPGERKHSVRWLFGTTLAVSLAALLTFLLRGRQSTVLVPVIFILVIIPCARYFGLLAGILGSICASGLFAWYLFEPYGKFAVSDHQALSNLALLLFAGIALSYANSGHEDEHAPPSSTLKP